MRAISHNLGAHIAAINGTAVSVNSDENESDDAVESTPTADPAPEARFPFKRNRSRWQAANHGCHCFDRAFLLAGVCLSASQ